MSSEFHSQIKELLASRNGTEPLFSPGSAIRRVNGKGLLIAGGPAALLEQLAHPHVAQGVHDFSEFEKHPYERLHKTLKSMYAIIFGTVEQAVAESRRLHLIHARIAGQGYRANDPELLMWVYATLVHTSLEMYDSLAPNPLGREVQEKFYEESREVMTLLGVPRVMSPRNLRDFEDYFEMMAASLEVSDYGRELAAVVMSPPGVWTLPLRPFERNLTALLLPARLREQYGMQLSASWQRVLKEAARASRMFAPLVPEVVQTLPVRMLGPGPFGMAGVGVAPVA